MKTLGNDEIRELNWFGLKRHVAALLGSRLFNPLVQIVGGAVLPQRLAQRLPLARSGVAYRLADGTSVRLLDTLRDIVARDIFFGKGKPTSNAERLKLAAIEILAKKASRFLDIGAYAGICALVAARSNPALKAAAYEIVPENFMLLMRNVLENDLATRVEPILRGIGSRASSVVVPSTIGLASNATSISLGSDFASGVEIAVIDLDSEVGESDDTFFLKIDVEGFEEDVFKGGKAFFAQHRPDIIVEILPEADATCAYILKELAPLGYKFFVFLDSGCVARDRIETEEIYHDWLMTVRDDIGEILSPLSSSN